MVVKGTILGDIIGSQYEYSKPENPQKCELFTKRYMFTDDTVMTLALKCRRVLSWIRT